MLVVHRGERTDVLAAALAQVLAHPLEDPFTTDVVAVPTRGVERWISQRLAHHLGAAPGDDDGVCSGIRFPSPASLVAEVVAVGSGVPPREDPWRDDALVWRVLEVVDRVADQPWCPVLGAHVGAVPNSARLPDPLQDQRRDRRWVAARRLAGLYRAYASQRPAMVRDWAAGRDTDGAGQDLPEHLAWQARFWRAVRDQVGCPSPPERLPAACTQVRDAPDTLDLPDRLSVFGPTRVTLDQVSVLHALAHGRDVHLWVPHPSPALWSTVHTLLAATDGGAAPPARRADPTQAAARHPLLAALGRDVRELQVVLAVAAAAPGAPTVHDIHHPAPSSPLPTSPLPPSPLPQAALPPSSLLTALQSAVARDDPSAGDPALDLAAGDGSVQVHACYGRARQVEVLRELLLGLLADDPTLEPRDILVMCPDVEAFAPLVTAAFGSGAGAAPPGVANHPGHRIRVRIADRSLRRTNPVLDVAATLLELAGGRCTATDVVDLAARPVVRRRFDLDDDDVERLRRWVADAGVRWGLDAVHRASYGLAGLAQNTWRAGLDRVLLGVAMRDEGGRHLATAVPLDDAGDDLDLAGRLAELLDRLQAVLDALQGPKPLREWTDALAMGTARLARAASGEEWQEVEAQRGLAGVVSAGGGQASTVPLSLADVRSLLRRLLEGRPTRANFRTGDLTVSSLVPMRSVPHRVVVLLGMDDGVGRGGRGGGELGDDVLATSPLVGERDPRSEFRQLVLDAVLAAIDRLVVLYDGADDRTNAVLPPAVAVAEILDALDATAVVPGGGRVRDAVTVRHPLQPVDPRHFRIPAPPGHPQAGRTAVHGFDPVARAGAVALLAPRRAAPPFLAEDLPALPLGDVALADLVAFLEHPVRTFVRRRLGVTVGEDRDDLRDDVPVDLDALQTWQVGDRLLRAVLRGEDLSAAAGVERLRGVVPPGTIGGRILAEVMADVQAVADALAAVDVDDPLDPSGGAAVTSGQAGRRVGGVDVLVDLPDGTRIAGTVPGVRTAAGRGRVLRTEFSRVRARHRLRAWVQVLGLAVTHPQLQWQAVTVGRGPSRRDAPPAALTAVLTVPAAAAAGTILADLVQLYRAGLCAPLPMAAETSAAYAAVAVRGGDRSEALRVAEGSWLRTGDQREPFGEALDPDHQLVWGAATLADLCRVPVRDGDLDRDLGRDARGAGQASRFEALADRVWQPLLRHEQLRAGRGNGG